MGKEVRGQHKGGGGNRPDSNTDPREVGEHPGHAYGPVAASARAGQAGEKAHRLGKTPPLAA
jgi:hypothetical protein